MHCKRLIIFDIHSTKCSSKHTIWQRFKNIKNFVLVINETYKNHVLVTELKIAIDKFENLVIHLHAEY